ncbi:hypothetical protein GCM10010129_67540 [Streptomyces fumigatiscleroticus]|nr:hypothetical protein GCM10010129_67540 [Streptomyces fumigatiscleroticus]
MVLRRALVRDLVRSRVLAGVALTAVTGFVAALPVVAAQPSPVPAARTAPTELSGGRPLVVLVPGTCADSSGRNGVIQRLRQDGRPARAAADPLRGPPTDTRRVGATGAAAAGAPP